MISPTPSNKKRQSNFELLRIVAMLMIIAHHLAVHGVLTASLSSINAIWLQVMTAGGKIGVNIYVLISGYFLSKSTFKAEKCIRLWLSLVFYAGATLALVSLTGFRSFSYFDLADVIAPLTRYVWWFATTYITIYLLSPVLNCAVRELPKRRYFLVLCMLLLFISVLHTPLGNPVHVNVIWFTILYLTGGYIRRYPLLKRWKSWHFFLAFFGLFLASVALGYCIMRLGYSDWLKVRGIDIYAANSVNIFLASVFLFLGVERINIPYNALVNAVASTTFGIYLLHDSSFIRSFLWQSVLKVPAWQNSKLFILFSVLVVFAVFAVGSVVEFIRQYTLERLYAPLLQRLMRLGKRKLNEVLHILNI